MFPFSISFNKSTCSNKKANFYISNRLFYVRIDDLRDYFSQISIHLPSGSDIQINVPNSLFSGSFRSDIPILLKCSIRASISLLKIQHHRLFLRKIITIQKEKIVRLSASGLMTVPFHFPSILVFLIPFF